MTCSMQAYNSFLFSAHTHTKIFSLVPHCPLQEIGVTFEIGVHVVFSCVQTMVWLPLFGNFNVRTDVDACDCTQGAVRTP